MRPIEEYLALRERPAGRAAMHQRWHDLLFLHTRVDPDLIQSLLPSGLQVDTFEDQAWLGLVPFRMSEIRPAGTPALPWISAFPETNLRTYVHHDGRPGVWFFSLDAARYLACQIARKFFSLPYYHAKMLVVRGASSMQYRSSRRDVTIDIECPLPKQFAPAEPGSFEFWLVERYLLYACRGGELFDGQVYHQPYEISALGSGGLRIAQNLTDAIGIANPTWEHACFSPGVTVEVFPLQRVRGS